MNNLLHTGLELSGLVSNTLRSYSGQLHLPWFVAALSFLKLKNAWRLERHQNKSRDSLTCLCSLECLYEMAFSDNKYLGFSPSQSCFCQISPLMAASYEGGASNSLSPGLAAAAAAASAASAAALASSAAIFAADAVTNSAGGAEGEGWSV